jgi:hypothetical protein
MKLRYYAPAYEERVHLEILQLLVQIKEKHSIEYEIIEIRKKESEYGSFPDPEHEKEIYTKDFKPRARTLMPRIGQNVARALRSRRGGFFIAGTIAAVERDKVEWFASYFDPLYSTWKSYDEKCPTSLGFLRMVLDKGVSLLQEVVSRGKESEHDKLIKEFINSNLLSGKFEEEVPIGKAMIVVDKYGEKKEVGRKFVDLVCKTPNGNWIIEVEPELNATALGQVLIYADIYSKASSVPVKCGIVCRNADEELLEICKKYVNEIFVLGKVWRKS